MIVDSPSRRTYGGKEKDYSSLNNRNPSNHLRCGDVVRTGGSRLLRFSYWPTGHRLSSGIGPNKTILVFGLFTQGF